MRKQFVLTCRQHYYTINTILGCSQQIALHCTYMTQLKILHVAASAPVPLKLSDIFVVAVSVTVMMMQAADATCSLAAIWLALGPSHGQEAAQQLRSVLPTVLGNGDTGITTIAFLFSFLVYWFFYHCYAC